MSLTDGLSVLLVCLLLLLHLTNNVFTINKRLKSTHYTQQCIQYILLLYMYCYTHNVHMYYQHIHTLHNNTYSIYSYCTCLIIRTMYTCIINTSTHYTQQYIQYILLLYMYCYVIRIMYTCIINTFTHYTLSLFLLLKHCTAHMYCYIMYTCIINTHIYCGSYAYNV